LFSLDTSQLLIDASGSGTNVWGSYVTSYSTITVIDKTIDKILLDEKFGEFDNSGCSNPGCSISGGSPYSFEESYLLDINPTHLFELSLSGFMFNDTDQGLRIATNLQTELSAVPIPPAIWLFGSALLGLVGFSKRRKSA